MRGRSSPTIGAMSHWENRPEPGWRKFRFNQPYAKGLERLRTEVLGKTDFDPATLWQWGTMQAMALIEVLKDCEAELGEAGQKLVYGALRRVGRDIGRQILEGVEIPEDISAAEFASFYATVINRIAYASLEEPRIDSDDRVSFDIVWCPHQDHYGAFDCRVQRYFVQGMLDAALELGRFTDFDVRFDSTIPAGAPTCHFTVWKGSAEEKGAWREMTATIEKKALEHAARRAKERSASSSGADGLGSQGGAALPTRDPRSGT
jgi:hypothetical protein